MKCPNKIVNKQDVGTFHQDVWTFPTTHADCLAIINGDFLLHGVWQFGGRGGYPGAKQNEQRSSQHFPRFQFLQEQLPRRLLSHDGSVQFTPYFFIFF